MHLSWRVHQHRGLVADNDQQRYGSLATRSDKQDSRMRPKTMLPLAHLGYDPNWIREFARQQGAWAIIPPKTQSQRPDLLYKTLAYIGARNLVERFLQQDQAMSDVSRPRYDNLAASYQPSSSLASIRIWRVLMSPWP